LLTKINKGNGLIPKLMTDTAYVKTVEQTLDNVSKLSMNTRKMSDDLQAMVAKMNSSENAVGLLLTDSAFAHQLKSTLTHAKSASIKLDDNMEALQHNFLLRGFFRKKKKEEAKKAKGK
ncbi:MAG: MCE family protein, partial [Cyclobacteriaceae bacterium]